MNTETVRSLGLFVRSFAEYVRTEGKNKQAVADARYYMGQAIETEQDLRDAAFVNEVQRLDHLSLSGSEHKVNPIEEAKKPVTQVVTPIPAIKSATADLTAKKSGLVNS